MQTNSRTRAERTHEGAVAARLTPLAQLRRSLMSCMLWEREFYEDGVDIAERITQLCSRVLPSEIAALAIEAREVGKLRHAPLLLLVALVKHGRGALVGDTVARVIRRADELSELLALYWKDGKRPLSAQLKRGLAKAFLKFDAYQLAKYDRARAIRLRDVLFLCHAKPDTDERAAIWASLVRGDLPAPDTWEVALSAGADKRSTFERLMWEDRLGYLALLRNLRNMVEAHVDRSLIIDVLRSDKGASMVLPFRYVAAARAAPSLEPEINAALLRRVDAMPPLTGSTVVLVDVSGSMDAKLSSKSDLTRLDAGAALASIVRSEVVRVFTFSSTCVEVPHRLGMAGIDAIQRSQLHRNTMLGRALSVLPSAHRLIVITDEQSHDNVPAVVPFRHRYMINVASAKNGVRLDSTWTHIDGFSENVLSYIAEVEHAR